MRREMVDKFEQLLQTEAALRNERTGMTNGELDWIVAERDAMLSEVNRLRAERGKRRITYEEFEKAEWTCQGHVDYGHKLALRCMEFVLDTD